ncbi:DNRLRE domain-containing protein [Pseudofrankia sp. DC12]|uniref:DNRLRE domain-containing protein n=1 Tax=Pseudofrankia sp. DC12 TaxID=683315 RepID=UPI000A767028|nr:DNRLRE domain-containing protein [Pseudofrankia sp. DC12]
MSGRHRPATRSLLSFGRLSFGRRKWRRDARVRRVAPLLAVLLVVVGLVVLDAPARPKAVPIADQNPFRGSGKLPASSSGSAAGKASLVPTSATQGTARTGPATLQGKAPVVAGAVASTGATITPLKQVAFTPQKPSADEAARAASTPRGAQLGPSRPQAVTRPDASGEMKPQAGRVEVPGLRTASSQVFHNPDGTYTSEATMGSDRFKSSKGDWVGIDTSLVAGDKGRLHARSTQAGLEVAPKADDAELGSIDLGGGLSFGFGIAQAAGVAAKVDGSKATFTGVRDQADLELGPTAGGLKEVLVLKSAAAPTTWVYPLTLSGLTASLDDQGDVQLLDRGGTVRALIPHGSMADSRPTTKDGFYAYSRGVTYSLVTVSNGQQALQVDLDKAWLAAPERVFPVKVDPNVSTLLTGADDTYVSSASPSTNYASELDIKAGYYSPTNDIVHGYLSFPGDASLTNATVTNAHVKIFNWFSASGCTPHPVSLRQVLIPWYGGNMTWPGATLGGEVANKSFADDGSSSCGGSWEFIGDYDTRLSNLVNTWTHDPTANFGLGLTTSDTDTQWLKSFYSNNCWCNPADPTSDYRPRLELEWTPYGAEYSFPSGSATWSVPPTSTAPGQITVRVKNTGQTTWTSGAGYALSYHIYDASNTFELIHQGVQTPIPTTVASGQSVDVNASVDLSSLSSGNYTIRWDMEQTGTSWFSGQGVGELATPVNVAAGVNQSPYIVGVSPISGSEVPSTQPTLGVLALDPDNDPLTYQFELCTGTDANSGTCQSSGWTSWPIWAPPTPLTWGQIYYWRVQVSDGTSQSLWTSPLALEPVNYNVTAGADYGANAYAPAVAGVNPLTQNFTTQVTDASLREVGPPLSVARSYNSKSTTDGLFGAGWTSAYDMAAGAATSGPGNIQIRNGDGRTTLFGRNGDGTYQPEHGYYASLQASKPRVASFTAANSTSSLGATDTGETWQALAGTWGVSNNSAYLVSAGIFKSVAVVPAPADGTIQFSTPTTQSRLGVAFRVQDADNMWMLYENGTSLVLAKRSGGLESTVKTVTGVCCATTDTYGVRMVGSTLQMLRNGVVVGTATDSAFSTATKAGLYAQSTGTGRIDGLTITPEGHRATFTAANSATSLGASDDGEAFTNLAGTWGINGNSAYLATAAGSGHNLSTVAGAADGTITFTEPVAQAGVGVAFRVADANNYWRLVAAPASNSWQLVKRVAGTDTVVATAASTCCTAADVLSIVTSGTSISVLRNGTQILSAHDPALLFASRAGPYADAAGTGRIDTFTTTVATGLTEKGGTSYTFRSDGKLLATTDPAGNRVALAYDANSRLTSATNTTSGRALTFTWTTDNTHIAQVATPSVAANGGALTWTYSYASGRLTGVATPGVATGSSYSYNSAGELTQISLPESNLNTKVGYNSDGTVAWREDGLGHRTTYAVTATSPNIVVRTTDPAGTTTDWTYSVYGQLLSKTGPTGTKTFTYNDDGFLAQATDENGNTTNYQTDAHGNVLARTVVRSSDASGTWPVTDYYDYYNGPPGDPRDDLIVAHRDGRSAAPNDNAYKTTYGYDPFGNLVSTTSPPTAAFPGGTTNSSTYTAGAETAVGGGTEPAGLLASRTDARGKVTTYGYDSKGDLRHDQDPAGLVHDYTTDEIGRRLTSKETSDTYPSGLTTTYTYTKLSQVATVTEPGVTNPITATTHTRVTTNTYDTNGNRTQAVISDATGGDTARTTTYTYDADDRLLSTTAASGTAAAATSAQTYDANGNLATTTDPNGTVTAYTYTPLGELATTTLKNFVDDPVAGTSPRDVVLESRAYDPAGRLASVTDALGRTTNYTYWLDGKLHQVTRTGYHNPDFATGTLSSTTRTIVLEDHSYDGAGNETSTVTGGGLTTATASYDQAGNATGTALDPAGVHRTTALSYDANGDPTAIETGAAGTSTTERTEYGYDNASRLTSTTVFGDGVARFTTAVTRDQRGYTTTLVDPRGYTPGSAFDPAYTTHVTTNPAGAVGQVTAPSVQVEENGNAASAGTPTGTVGYDTFGEVTQTRDARNLTTTTTYDALGRPTQVSHPSYTPPGGSASTPSESFTYDHNGNVLTHVDTRGQTTTAVYDMRDRVVSVTDPQVDGLPAPGVSRAIYDDASNLVTTVDQNGAWIFYAYDDLDRLWATTSTERTPSATFSTYYGYDDAGDLDKILRPTNVSAGAAATADYDGAGELTATHDEAGKTTTYTYDLAGRLASSTDPLGRKTTYAYDRAGRQTGAAQFSNTNSPLRSLSIGYDAAGNVTSQTDPNGNTTTDAYDALDQLRSITVPVAAGSSLTTSAGYDAAGNRTRLTDGNGNATITTFNSLGLPEKTIEPSTTAYPNLTDRTWTTSYDTGGLPTTVVEPGGVTRTSTYNALGQLIAEAGSGTGVASASRTLAYDLAGNLTNTHTPSADEEFSYDDRGLLTGSQHTEGDASFGYDADGRMTTRWNAALSSGYTYDSRGNLATVTGAGTTGTRTYSYDDADQLTSIDYTSSGSGAVETYGYDQLARTTSDTLTGPSGTLRSQTYTYDTNDNLTATTIGPAGVAGAGSQSYGYDQANRLTSWTDQAATTTAYGWDAAGNRVSAGGVTSTFDARNRLLNDGSAGYTYTARGTVSTTTTASATTSDTFNALDQLTSVTSGPTTTSYEYDALGRVSWRNSSQAFAYEDLSNEPSYHDGTLYAYDPTGKLIGADTGSAGLATLTNPHGDTIAAFTTTGTLTDTRTYDPFGTPTTTGTSHLEIGYQGGWTDPTTSQLDADTRWYTPTNGTFTTRDSTPLPWTGTAADNRYTYAGGNPLTYSDPTGQSFLSVIEKAPGVRAVAAAGSLAVGLASQGVANAYNAGYAVGYIATAAASGAVEGAYYVGYGVGYATAWNLSQEIKLGTAAYHALAGSGSSTPSPSPNPNPNSTNNPNPSPDDPGAGTGAGAGAGAGPGAGSGPGPGAGPGTVTQPGAGPSPATNPAQQTYPDPNDVIHGTLNINPDSTHGVGNNGTIPKPTDVPQTYSNPLDANLGPATDQTAGLQYTASADDCHNAGLTHCIGDDPATPPTQTGGAGAGGGDHPPTSTSSDAGDDPEGEIPYNSTDLSSAAYKARVEAGIGPGRNVAAARVPGWNDPRTGDLVYGFSKGNGYHSEIDILNQLKARGFSGKSIAELYSERQPCGPCGATLAEELRPGVPISWSVPWGEDATLRTASNELLRRMIGTAGGY